MATKMKNIKQITDKALPTVTIVMTTYNVARTLPRLLKSVEKQDYPKNKLTMVVADGNSTDTTVALLHKSKLHVRVVKSKYPRDPEASKGVALIYAKGEIVCLLDADNVLPHEFWIRKQVMPFLSHKEIVGTATLRFAYRKHDTYLNRYFALIGSADPVGMYLGKADKLSYLYDRWNLYGKILEETKEYWIITFSPSHFPTLGSNGFFARRRTLLKGKADPEHFFHIDTPLDVARLGMSTYAVTKDAIVHDTATTLIKFLTKRVKYMQLHYDSRSKDRRYKVFDPDSAEDKKNIIKFVFYSFTFFQPTWMAIRGYWKIQDPVWFIHPVFCFAISMAYGWAIISKKLQSVIQ